MKQADRVAVAILLFAALAWCAPAAAAFYYRHQALEAYELARIAENRLGMVDDAIAVRDDEIARLEAELTDVRTELADTEALLTDQTEEVLGSE